MSNNIPTPKFVIDTVGLVLHLEKRRLEPEASDILQKAEVEQVVVYVPAMVLAEILYLSERQKIKTSLNDVSDYLTNHPGFVEYPLNLHVFHAAQQITDIPELHDRLIAATAKALDTKLITNDLKIRASSFVQTVW
ncbi:MAG: PIN domain-containing protein [Ardenticatenaceae bacterium]|nr:PIN domain-containing protein [Ardenticatenaceae bacterium]MCB9446690.1 PIN domain-containing protein [Ardenticatenaceae bacterium]